MKLNPQSGSNLVVYVWFCQQFGGFWPTLFVGPFSDAFNPKWLIIIMVPLIFQMLPFLLFGCMVDDKVQHDLKNKWNSKKFIAQWKLMFIGILIGLFAISLSVIFALSYLVQALFAIIASVIMILLILFWMPNIIAGAFIYLFLTTALDIGTGESSYYWLLADETCVPNGPAFSFTFYHTYASIISTLFQFIGLWLFNLFLKGLQIRTMFWLTSLMHIFSNIIGVFLYTRTNLVIGISDKVFYLFTSGVFAPTIYMMNFMPSNILIAKLCPKDVEVTVYAILSGFSNFGQQVAKFIGIYFSQALGIETIEPCNWDNFVLQMSVIAIVPILEIPLTFLLIPKGKATDDFLRDIEFQAFKKVEEKP